MGDPLITKVQNHFFGETADIHVESTFRDYDNGLTIVNHSVLVVEHTKNGKIINRNEFAIGITITADGAETWGYTNARFSQSFLQDTQYLDQLRSQLFDSESVTEQYWNFILQTNHVPHQRLETGAPHN